MLTFSHLPECGAALRSRAEVEWGWRRGRGEPQGLYGVSVGCSAVESVQLTGCQAGGCVAVMAVVVVVESDSVVSLSALGGSC